MLNGFSRDKILIFRNLLLLPVLLLISLNFAEAQQTKVYSAGVLGPPGRLDERLAIKGLRDGLKEAGYLEGQNLLLNMPNVKTYDELRLIYARLCGISLR